MAVLVLAPEIFDPIRAASDRHGIQFTLAVSLAVGESGLDPQITAGYRYTIAELRQLEADYPDDWWELADVAIGLFQLHTRGAGYGLSVAQFIDPAISADRGLQYLAACFQAAGDENNALSCYNQGIGGWRERGMLDEQVEWIANILRRRYNYEAEGIARRGSSPPGIGGGPLGPSSPLPTLPSYVPPAAVPTAGELERILSAVENALGSAISWLRDNAGSLGSGIASALESMRNGLTGGIRTMLSDVAKTLTVVTGGIGTAVSAGLDAAGTGIEQASTTIAASIKDVVKTAYDTIASILTPLASKLKDGMAFARAAMDDIVDGIATGFDSIGTALGTLRTDFTAEVGDVFKDVISTLNSVLEKSKDWYNNTVTEAEASLTAVRNTLSSALGNVIGGIKAGFEYFGEVFIPALNDLAKNIGDAIWRSMFDLDLPADAVASFLADIRAIANTMNQEAGT